MSKKLIRTVGKVAMVVGAVAMMATGIGTVLGGTMMLSVFGTSIAASAIAAAASLVSVGASMLGKPKSPKIGEANNDRLNVSINVLAPRVMAFGETALATDLRDQEFTGTDKEYLHRFIVTAAHKINGYKEIWFDEKLAWNSTGGVQGEFVGYLQVTTRTEGTAANAINISARMGSTRRFTGCAYVYLRFKLTGNSKKTESPFAQQVPTRMTIVGEAVPCYDPRQDSTQPGGSGAHRADNQATWTYDTHARNPACQLATWLLGWRIQNPQDGTWKLSVGGGIPANRIDWASFIEAANLCDETVTLAVGGTEPRYRGDGLANENAGPTETVEAFTATMNADLDDQDGLLRLTVFHNDLATPDAYFTQADVQDEYTWLQTQGLNESFNVVRGNYVDPASLYQPTPADEVRIASRDGIDRVHPADFGMVQSRSQDARLRKQRLQRQLYGGEFRATFLTPGWKVHKNSVIYLTFSPEGWTNKKFRVAEYEGARPDGLVPMVLREEHEDIYAWDAEEGPAVQIADPTYYAPGDTPVAQFLGTIDEGATRNVPAQLLQDGVFLDQFWTLDGLSRAFAYLPAPAGYALEIPYNGDVDSFSGYGGLVDAYILIHPGKSLWFRFVCDPRGHEFADLFEGEDPLFDGDDVLLSAEYYDASWELEAVVDWFAADGTFIQRDALASVDPSGVQQTIDGTLTPPVDAWRMRLLFGHSAQTGVVGSWAVWSPWVAEHEPSSDVTSYIDAAASTTIACDSSGSPKPGQLDPRYIQFTLIKGGASVTGAEWAITPSLDIDATIDSDGLANVTEAGATGTLFVEATFGGVTRTFTHQILRAIDVAISGGGSTGGTSGGASLNGHINSTTPIDISGEVEVTIGTDGAADLTALLEYSGSTGVSLNIQFYQWNGSSWVPIGSAAGMAPPWYSPGSPPWYIPSSGPGGGTYQQTVTGLTPATTEKFKLYAWVASAYDLYISGYSFSVTGR